MTTPTMISRDDLQDAAASAIGHIVLVLSRLEFNLGLYLRNAVGGPDPESANPLIQRLSFKGKLDALLEIVEHKLAAQSEARRELQAWLKEMEAFRQRRNSFVHGRWGFLAHAQQAVNVASELPGRKPVKEVRYSISELQAQLAECRRLAAGFDAWSHRWRL